MAVCERLSACPVVNDSKNGSAAHAEKIKEKYCNKDYEKCARYMVLKSIGGDFIPNDLLPEEVERAKEIIDEGLEWL